MNISLFYFFQGMHLCFLGLYAFVILFSFHKPLPSVYEVSLMCWIGVIIVDEIRQVSQELVGRRPYAYPRYNPEPCLKWRPIVPTLASVAS